MCWGIFDELEKEEKGNSGVNVVNTLISIHSCFISSPFLVFIIIITLKTVLIKRKSTNKWITPSSDKSAKAKKESPQMFMFRKLLPRNTKNWGNKTNESCQTLKKHRNP